MMQCCGSQQCSVVELGLKKLFWSVLPTWPNMLLRKLLMFSFLILVIGERINIEIKMDRRHRVVMLLQMKMKLVGVNTKLAHMRWDNKMESDTSSEITRVKFADLDRENIIAQEGNSESKLRGKLSKKCTSNEKR